MDTLDFGKEWFNIPCSEQYFTDVRPLFSELRNMREKGRIAGQPALCSAILEKTNRYYVPILRAFLDELNRLARANTNIPELLIHYLTGALNKPSGKLRPIVDVPRLKFPKRIYHAGFKPGSDNTIEVVCDEGWAISMRIHNASSKVEPSLKFDVNLIALPGSMHAQVEPW